MNARITPRRRRLSRAAGRGGFDRGRIVARRRGAAAGTRPLAAVRAVRIDGHTPARTRRQAIVRREIARPAASARSSSSRGRPASGPGTAPTRLARVPARGRPRAGGRPAGRGGLLWPSRRDLSRVRSSTGRPRAAPRWRSSARRRSTGRARPPAEGDAEVGPSPRTISVDGTTAWSCGRSRRGGCGGGMSSSRRSSAIPGAHTASPRRCHRDGRGRPAATARVVVETVEVDPDLDDARSGAAVTGATMLTRLLLPGGSVSGSILALQAIRAVVPPAASRAIPPPARTGGLPFERGEIFRELCEDYGACTERRRRRRPRGPPPRVLGAPAAPRSRAAGVPARDAEPAARRKITETKGAP